MCGDYFNQKAVKIEKAPAITSYDIHIYVENAGPKALENIIKAGNLAQALIEAIPQAGGPHHVAAGRGPHLLANVEVTIPPEALSKALTLLQMNSAGLSILVHPHTGDEMRDHTALANWVGKPVPLDLDALLPPSQRKKAANNNSAPKFKP
jgi:DOPA 4,5-dioxygenase